MSEFFAHSSALKLAILSHGDQKRKYTGEPYIVHPIEVAEIVSDFCPANYHLLSAALLHDVLEDTHCTYDDVKTQTSMIVADTVLALSDFQTPKDGNREHRKSVERTRLSQQSYDVQTIKYADLISNAISIARHDKRFAVTFAKEMRLLLDAMTGGNALLRKEAYAVLERVESSL